MADRVVLMRCGRIEQNGAPVDLYENPANTFVARFIGTPPMNLLRLESAQGGAVIAGTDGAGARGRQTARAARWACAPSTCSSRSRTACARRSRASNTWAATRSSPAGSARRRSRCASPGSVPFARGDATWLRWPAGGPALFRCRRIAQECARPRRASPATLVDLISDPPIHRHIEEETMMIDHSACWSARWRFAAAVLRRRRACAGAGRSSVLLSGRRRRSDHQDHRRLRGRLREGESRHQAEADLFRQLPGIDRQGADRRQERRSAGHVDPAVDRHVHADRRGRDRSVRRSRQDRRRQGVAQELLSRRSWRTARPAARPGAFRSSARRSSSTTTRTRSRKRGSTRTIRRRPGPR